MEVTQSNAFKMKLKTTNHNKTKAFKLAFLLLLNSPAAFRRRREGGLSFRLPRNWTVPTGI